MAVRKISIYPDPVLLRPAQEVADFDSSLGELIDDMFETMYAAEGIGLAAPQVATELRVAVVDVSREGSNPIELVNPIVVEKEGVVDSEEGCLSIPNYRDTIRRARRVVVHAQDRRGKTFELDTDGILAICLQHEMDHLDGVLFIDHLSRLKRELFKRWLRKHLPLETER